MTNFREITDALLGMLYPHYLAPVPSMSVVEFLLDPEQGKLTSGYLLPTGTQLYSRPIDGTQCRFRTCYPTTLWPITLAAVKVQPAERALPGGKPAAIIKLELHSQGGLTFKDLQVDRLRFYLHGEAPLAYALYEMLLNRTYEVRCRPAGGRLSDKPIILPTDCLRPVGFGMDEGLLPYPSQALLGYRLLQEYFTFPQKFLFVELGGLQKAVKAGIGNKLEVEIVLSQPLRSDQVMSTDTFRLGCAPVVNLFTQLAEPIRLDQTQHEYRVIPDVRRLLANEIYSIDAVSLVAGDKETVRPVQPIYSLKHTRLDSEQSAFWYQTRKPSDRKGDAGTEIYVSLVDLAFDPTVPAGDTLTFSTTCTNRGLPDRLAVDDPRGDFELEKAAPGGADTCAGQTDETGAASVRRRNPVAPDLPSVVELSLPQRGRSTGVTGDTAAVRFFRFQRRPTANRRDHQSVLSPCDASSGHDGMERILSRHGSDHGVR